MTLTGHYHYLHIISQLKFHSSEYKEFLTSKTNFELYAKSEDENISKRICPIFFMNYKSENEQDLKRGNLPNSFKQIYKYKE